MKFSQVLLLLLVIIAIIMVVMGVKANIKPPILTGVGFIIIAYLLRKK